jgi:hypothetical protein
MSFMTPEHRRRLACLIAMGLVATGVVGAGRAAKATPTAPAAGSKTPLPHILNAVESSAEDIVDLALAGERARVVTAAKQLKSEARASLAVLRAAGVPRAQLVLLRQRADRVAAVSAGLRLIGVALAANQVSQLMPSLYSRFANPVPPALLRLDYLDREAELDSLAGRADRVPPLVGELDQTWSGIRSAVLARGGAKEAAAFDRHVAAMKRLATSTGKPLQREAVNGLNLVDSLEGVFRR